MPFLEIISNSNKLYQLLFARSYFQILEKFEKGEFDVDDVGREVGRNFVIYLANLKNESFVANVEKLYAALENKDLKEIFNP